MEQSKSSNKVSAKEIRSVMIELLSNGYHHIKAINSEIHTMGIKEPEKASEEDQNKLRALTLTLTLINDLIHPAHKMSKKLLNKCELPIIDYCMKAQKVAFESKLVDECFCNSCKEDKNEI